MATEVDRKTLYKQIWDKPMMHLGTDYGVSGSWLRKVCINHDIPVPERGYWAKKKAGHKVKPIPLTKRGPGVSQTITIGGGQYYHHYPKEEEIIATPLPPEPTFSEPLDDFKKRIKKLLRGCSAKATLQKPHRDISKLLIADRERISAQEADEYTFSWDKAKFETIFEKKRLKILNGLFTLLEGLGMKCTQRGKEGRDIYIRVGTTDVGLSLDSPEYLDKNIHTYYRKEVPDGTPLHIKIGHHKELEGIQSLWEGGRLDSKKCLKEIAFSIIIAAEIFHRNHALFVHKQTIKRKENAIENRRKRIEEAERQERERIRKLEEARVNHLLGLGEALAKAEKIRILIASMKAKQISGHLEVSSEEIEDWASWAMEQANKLDPIGSGKILESIRLKEAPNV